MRNHTYTLYTAVIHILYTVVLYHHTRCSIVVQGMLVLVVPLLTHYSSTHRVEVRLGRAPRGKILPMSRLLHTTFPTSPPVPGVLPPAPRGLPSCLHPGGSAHSEATRESRASSSARPGASIPAMTTSPGRSTLYWPCAAPESPQRAPPVCGAEKIQRYVYILV